MYSTARKRTRGEAQAHTKAMASSTPVPPPHRRSTTWDLEMEERAQYLDPSSQADGSLWDQLQAFSHATGHQVLETASEWLSEVRGESILPLS